MWPFLLACDAFLQGMAEERARSEAARAERPPAEAPATEGLPAAPSTGEAVAWLADEGLCALRDERLVATAGAAAGVAPHELSRAWRAVDRASPGDPTLKVLAACALFQGAGFASGDRRAFLDEVGLEALFPLLPWVGRLTVIPPEDALVAYLDVMSPGEVEAWLKRTGLVDVDDGEWSVDAQRLEGLPDALLDAIERRLDAGVLGPRSQVVRAIARERARRSP